jgi:hypothetical protein
MKILTVLSSLSELRNAGENLRSSVQVSKLLLIILKGKTRYT